MRTLLALAVALGLAGCLGIPLAESPTAGRALEDFQGCPELEGAPCGFAEEVPLEEPDAALLPCTDRVRHAAGWSQLVLDPEELRMHIRLNLTLSGAAYGTAAVTEAGKTSQVAFRTEGGEGDIPLPVGAAAGGVRFLVVEPSYRTDIALLQEGMLGLRWSHGHEVEAVTEIATPNGTYYFHGVTYNPLTGEPRSHGSYRVAMAEGELTVLLHRVADQFLEPRWAADCQSLLALP